MAYAIPQSWKGGLTGGVTMVEEIYAEFRDTPMGDGRWAKVTSGM